LFSFFFSHPSRIAVTGWSLAARRAGYHAATRPVITTTEKLPSQYQPDVEE
jgi:hypothetical protein